MSSKKPPDLLPLDGFAQPTAADLAALRRGRATRENLLERVNDLAFPADLFEARPKRRRTAEGWEPFEI